MIQLDEIKKLTDQIQLDRLEKIANQVKTVVLKNRVLSIGSAIALVTFYKLYTAVIRPPTQLRHIPAWGYWDFLKMMFSRDVTAKSLDITMKLLEKENYPPVYLRPHRTGWTVFAVSPLSAKQVYSNIDLYQRVNSASDDQHQTLYNKFLGGSNVVFSNGYIWKNHRRIVSPAFHRSMPVKIFGEKTIAVFRAIERNQTYTIQVNHLMDGLTLDVIGKAGFDFDFEAISKGKESEWTKIYNDLNTGIRDPLFYFFRSLDERFLWLFPERQRLHRELERFNKMIESIIVEKREKIKDGFYDVSEDHEKDLLTLMLETESSEGYSMTNEDIQRNLLIFFAAGHDTTAGSLGYVLYYLSTHLDIQEKARKEVLEILGDNDQDVYPTTEQIKKMKYLNQIIKETMRINCVILSGLPRVSIADSTIGGYFVPKGTSVTFGMYDIHHHPRIWENPNVFNPDRFAPEGEASHNPEEGGHKWLPFSHGYRQCIGMSFSLAEQQVFLSMFLKKYTWTLPNDSIHKQGVINTGSNVTAPLNLHINIKKRYE